jgi:hypothetical protein
VDPKLVQTWQAYQNLYWESCLREKVQEEWKAYKDSLAPGVKGKSSFYLVVMRCYKGLPESEKAVVEQHRKKMKEVAYYGFANANLEYQRYVVFCVYR